MRNNLHVFLGATVADAAARPLHWVYDQKKLLTYIKGKKDFAFLKVNKSPFYNIKTGKVVLDPPCEDLKTYKLKVEDEQIFIEL